MSDVYPRLAEILEVDEVKGEDVLADFPIWDSLTVLSVIAMLGEEYGVHVSASDLRNWTTASELADNIACRKSA